MEERDYPALYRSADAASQRAQSRHINFIKIYSALLILAAGLGVYGIDHRPAAILAAILIIASIFASVFMLINRDESAWYRARAIAESVKTSAWRFMMRAEPYSEDEDDRIGRVLLANRIRRILEEHRDLSHELGGETAEQEQITTRMLDTRGLPWRDRAQFYRDNRIDEQRAWYARKSGYNSRQGKLWLGILITCQALAVLFVILRVAYPHWGYWPAEVFVVAAGSALTWIQAKRFRELSAAYALTAHEVGVIRAELEDVSDENEFGRFVADSENAFSREHTQWLARKDAI